MKIAILTHPLMFNYGGILQNFALQTVLRNNCHDVVTLHRLPDFYYDVTYNHIKGYLSRLYHRVILHEKVKISWNPNFSKKRYEYLFQNLKPFVERNMTLTDPITDLQLPAFVKTNHYDAYVVGSDQVWIPSYAKQSFIDFDKRTDIVKVLYAASCGNKSWMDDDSLISECRELAHDFKAISAREPEIANRASAILNCKVEWVLDPTLLLEKNDYLEAITLERNCGSFIFAYILDKTPQKMELINSVANMLGVGMRFCSVDETKPGKSLDWWINSINNANFVITDSFHGTAFSIIFQKQFCVFGNSKRGNARFESLLNLTGLGNRLFDSSNEIENLINNKIDYDDVTTRLALVKTKSLRFLLSNLQNKKA